ncbi:hypothetical protein HDU67_003381, partial [Dinochytrium kinnereticum]
LSPDVLTTTPHPTVKSLKRTIKISAEKVRESGEEEREGVRGRFLVEFTGELRGEALKVNEWYERMENEGSRTLARLSGGWRCEMGDEEKEG